MPLGADRAAIRSIFVREGQATFYRHPVDKNVEKYVYGINLCSYYVWRLNISADFTDYRTLAQVFVNGNAVHSRGTQSPFSRDRQRKGATISKVIWLRPEAHLGESVLALLVYHI